MFEEKIKLKQMLMFIINVLVPELTAPAIKHLKEILKESVKSSKYI